MKKIKNKGYHCKQMRGGQCNCEEKLGTHRELKSGFKGLTTIDVGVYKNHLN